MQAVHSQGKIDVTQLGRFMRLRVLGPRGGQWFCIDLDSDQAASLRAALSSFEAITLEPIGTIGYPILLAKSSNGINLLRGCAGGGGSGEWFGVNIEEPYCQLLAEALKPDN